MARGGHVLVLVVEAHSYCMVIIMVHPHTLYLVRAIGTYTVRIFYMFVCYAAYKQYSSSVNNLSPVFRQTLYKVL